jgi:hypothetical protein
MLEEGFEGSTGVCWAYILEKALQAREITSDALKILTKPRN